ncbi:immunoglobulin-like domain-containing protein [Sulfurovum sp.]|uniref:immunoglobulin-like domain-containing protein n=1 Tax=Sulfurovum sp. TaxID=1969726 RepID=UPI00356B02C9
MNKIVSFGLVIGAMLSLVGCGGSSTTTSSDVVAKGVGTYNDSAVSGVSYTCGTEIGVTDENGTFTFDIGQSCTFSIEDIILSIIDSSSFEDENATILVEDIAVAQFLQSIDLDGDASNGITITPEIIDVLSEGNITTLPDTIVELEEAVALLEAAAAEDNSTLEYTGTVVPEAEAVAHLEETKATLDVTAPVITIDGSNPLFVTQYANFSAPESNVTDDFYDDINATVTGLGLVDAAVPDTYILTYTAVDGAGNSSSKELTVIVQDITIPVITLIGDNFEDTLLGGNYVESGATALDNTDGDISVNISIDASAVDTNTLGSYVVTYNVQDAAGNAATQVTRTVNVIDTVAPVITLVGDAVVNLSVGDSYVEAGATVMDNSGEIIVAQITGVVDTATPGTYTVYYNAKDAAGNVATQVTRTVNVVDVVAPVVTLSGANPQTLEVKTDYVELGATATDTVDGTRDITINTTLVDMSTLGSYIVTYTATDVQGNVGDATRTVNVVDTTAPVITLTGSASITLIEGEVFDDQGATCTDNYDAECSVTASGTVDTAIGSYTITYSATDSSGNATTEVSRTINVVENTAPVFTLPSTYYMDVRFDTHYDNGQAYSQFEAEQFNFSAVEFSTAELVFVNGEFILDPTVNNTGYVLENGVWVPETDTMTIVLSVNDTVATLDGIHKLTISSSQDITDEIVNIEGTEANVTMPSGAERVSMVHEIITDEYGIHEQARTNGLTGNEFYLSLVEVVQYQCGTRWFTDAKEGSGIVGISFTCGQETQTSGTLVGVQSDNTLVPDVGTWEIITLPGSSMQAIVTTIDAAYQAYNDTPLFAENGDAQIWRGWHNAVGMIENMTLYNQVAFDAMSDKIIELESTIPMTEAMLTGKVFYTDGGSDFEQISFISSSEVIFREILIAQDGSIIFDSGSSPSSYIINSLGEVVITFDSGDTNTYKLISMTDTQWNMVKNNVIDSPYNTWLFTAPVNFPSSNVVDLLTLLEGQTKYFANSLGGTGFRTYATDGNYTGSVTLADGTTFATSGTYDIVDNILTINRASPSPSTLVLTYLGEQAGGLGFDITVDGGPVFQVISFATESERDAYLASLGSNIFITEAMLTGKTFYDTFTQSDGGICYANMTLSAISGTRHEICTAPDGTVITDDEFPFPVQLLDGKVIADAGDAFYIFTLTAEDATAWTLFEEEDWGKDGVIDMTGIITWYLSKPIDFPSTL